MAGLVKLGGIFARFVGVGIVAHLSGYAVLTCPLRGCARRREIAIAAQDHVVEPFSCPAHILLTILGDGQSAEFLRRKLQFLRVVC